MGIHLGEEVEGALGNTLMGESSSAAPLIRPGLDPGLWKSHSLIKYLYLDILRLKHVIMMLKMTWRRVVMIEHYCTTFIWFYGFFYNEPKCNFDQITKYMHTCFLTTKKYLYTKMSYKKDLFYSKTVTLQSQLKVSLVDSLVCCLFFCLDPPGCRSHVALSDLTSFPPGRTSDVTAAAFPSHWLEPWQPHPWVSPIPWVTPH